MKIGLITDTHNQYQKIELARTTFCQLGCSHVLHCGDFCDLRAYSGMLDDRYELSYVTDHNGHDFGMPNNPFQHLTVANKTIALYHNTYDKDTRGQTIVRALVDSQEFDIVLYGHLHYINLRLPDKYNRTVAINPGGYYFDDLSTFCVLDIFHLTVDVFYWYGLSFVHILRLWLDKRRFIPTVYNRVAATAFFEAFRMYARKLRMEDYIHSDKDSGTQWLSKNLNQFLNA
jgi:uncharacterized protein